MVDIWLQISADFAIDRRHLVSNNKSMATSSSAELSDDGDDHKVIGAWIVNYYCRLLWNEFQSLGRLEKDWMILFARDVCAAPNIARPPPDADQEKDLCERLLIRFMFSLTDNTDILTGKEESKDCSRLEHAMRAFEKLVKLDCIRHQLDDSDLKKMRILLKEQSVLVCWKKGDYDLARVVCDRQYQYFEDLDVQKSLDKLHRALLHRNTDVWSSFSSFSDLIDFSKEVLKKVFNVMSVPVLMKFRRCIAQCIKEDEANVDLQPSATNESLSSQLPDLEQDCSTNSEGVGINVPDPDAVQLPSPEKTPAPCDAGHGSSEPVIEIQSQDSDSNEESDDKRPKKKKIKNFSASSTSSEIKKEEASTSKAVDYEREFDLFFDGREEEKYSSRGIKRKKAWTTDEEKKVYTGVQKFGVGKWKEIAVHLATGRSNVDVKDKWRNMEKHGKIQEYMGLYGPY